MCGQSANCSIRNFYLATLLVVWGYLHSCCASVVVYIVAPDGIVIGADGMGIDLLPCGYAGPPRAIVARKIFLLKHKLALGYVGLARIKTENQRTVLYDLPTFIEFIEYNLGADATVNSLARIIEDEAPKALSFLPDRIMNPDYACKVGENKPFNPRFSFHDYWVAGYESGVPLIYDVNLKIEGGHVSPARVPIEPSKGQRIDARTGSSFNVWFQFPLVCAPETQPNRYETAFSSFPSQKQSFCAYDFSRFTLEQASDVVRTLIEVFTKVEPDHMGFPITIVSIPRDGNGWVRTYSKPFPSLPDKGTVQEQAKGTLGKRRAASNTLFKTLSHAACQEESQAPLLIIYLIALRPRRARHPAISTETSMHDCESLFA